MATDAANDLHLFIAAEDNLPLPETDAVLTLDQRTQIAKQCSKYITMPYGNPNANDFCIVGSDYKASLGVLNKCLSGGDVSEFVAAIEDVMRKCSFTLKKVDKKKDR